MIAAPFLSPAVVAAAPCNRSNAVSAIRSARVTIPASQSLSGEAVRVDPAQADKVICLRLPNGTRAMAVTIASGGTAGDVDWIVFVAGRGAYGVSLIRGGYKLGLTRAGPDLIESEPVYKASDPNCCPSGGFVHRRWRWNGSEFAVLRTWHDSSYRS